ncbi:hypothetical protein [Pseudomonas sp. R5(2019)]|uniref:hypothetical protein n=1 Tax=Pseudomonas sp. R5(2019) TaxID=2697566 RepID=UPI001411F61E|nr:hypothetical protein [Pseudomonas sp. R5(2019)]NBA97402.1 hypothetical protein [Pseudomonas sp. R5(2019)]
MDIKKTRLWRLLSVILLVGWLGVGTVSAEIYPDGSIAFFNKEGDQKCSIPFVSGFRALHAIQGCSDNQAYYFGLSSVPSATRFFLCSERLDLPVDGKNNCLNQFDWKYTLKTTRVITTTDKIRISDLTNKAPGTVVVPGVVVVKIEHNGGNIDGKLSAVKIFRSAPGPGPTTAPATTAAPVKTQ